MTLVCVCLCVCLCVCVCVCLQVYGGSKLPQMSSPIASCCIYWDSTSRRTRSLLIPACLNSQLVWGWVPHFCFLGAGITGKSSHCLALVVVLGIQTQVCTELCWAISPVLVRHLTDSHSYIIIYLHIKTTLRLQLLGWLRYTILNNKFSIFFPSEIFFFLNWILPSCDDIQAVVKFTTFPFLPPKC